MSGEPQGEFEATGPGGFRFRVRGYDTLVVIALLGLGGIAYLIYDHAEKTEKALIQFSLAIAEGVKAQQENVKVQRFTACIIATKEEQREAQYSSPTSFCNRIAP